MVIKKGFKQAIPILIITGMGGALGRVIQTIPLEDYALEVSTFSGFGGSRILRPLILTIGGSLTFEIFFRKF